MGEAFPASRYSHVSLVHINEVPAGPPPEFRFQQLNTSLGICFWVPRY